MTRTLEAEVVVPAQCELAEGPVWDAARGLLRWVDILPGHVHALDPATGAHSWFDAGDPVGAVGLTTGGLTTGGLTTGGLTTGGLTTGGLTRGGGLVLALSDHFALAEHDGRNLRRLGEFAVDGTAVRFNDGKPDPWGGFCAGTMARDEQGGPPCSLYRLRPDGAVAEIVGDVGLSNGLDWTADRRSFYFADSASGGVDVFDTDPDTGTLGRRRRFAEVGGLPDGLTLDVEGCVWVAAWGTGELLRFTPDARLDTVVRLPARQVTSAAFGGPGLATLYITTARENFTPADRQAEPHAGDIFALTPGTPGRPPNLFAA